MDYFPPDTWGTPPNFYAGLATVISESLLDMDEFPLWQGQSLLYLYRFVLRRNFHPALCITITEAEQGTGELTAKILTSPPESATLPKSGRAQWVKQGKTYYQATATLASNDYQALQKAFEAAKFWEMAPTDEHTGSDGSIWLLEAFANGHYHAVMRWSPEAGVFRDLALEMLAVGAITLEYIY